MNLKEKMFDLSIESKGLYYRLSMIEIKLPSLAERSGDLPLFQRYFLERFAKEYDVWEDIDQYRWSFFIGGWAAKKIHPVGEEKLKRDLEKLAKKRREAEEKKLKKG